MDSRIPYRRSRRITLRREASIDCRTEGSLPRTCGKWVTSSPKPTALVILERDDPYNLMIIDIVMAGVSGVDTARLARRTRPDLKVLFCSGYADLSRFEGEVGNEVGLKKPFRPDILAEAVRTALGRVGPSDGSKIVPLRRIGPS